MHDYLFQKMKFVVYFYEDKAVEELEEDDVILGNFAEYQLEEWKKAHECMVKAIYNGEVYDACVLQVCVQSRFVVRAICGMFTFAF